jgi:hypothetical protein
MPFHGDDTGSNPVGDANKIKHLQDSKSCNISLARLYLHFHFVWLWLW